jgi:enoyl-CoA hydratase
MPDDQPLALVERRGAVAWLTLNRPAKLNALSSDLIAAATDAVRALDTDDGPKVVVLRGAGRAFAAGADVRELRGLTPETARAFITRLHELFAAIRAARPLVLAAVRGPALGAGCELVAACDLRVCSTNASFGMPEVRVGIPSVIEAAMLAPIMGLARAQHLVYTGDSITAAEALAGGLVTAVYADDRFEAEVDALAVRLGGYSRSALRLQKALVQTWYDGSPLDRAIRAGIDALADAYTVPDPGTAIDAMLERRDHRFE